MKILLLGFLLGSFVSYITKQYIGYINKVRYVTFSKGRYLMIYSIILIILWCSSCRSHTNTIYILLIWICLLVVIIDVIDSKTMYIPDHLLVMVLGYILLYTNHISTITIFERIIGTLLCSIPMLLMNILIMETFGGGDVKLVMLFGYFLGYAIVLVMVIAIMAGGIYSFWLLYIKRIEQKYIPFAPFLCKSILLVIFWGKDIIAWYFRI